MTVIESHLAFLRLGNRRPSTISHRRSVLRQFERHIAPRSLLGARRPDALTFLGRELAPESRRAYRGHLKGFYAWALDEGILMEDPTDRIPGVRVPKRVPRPLSHEQVSLALAAAPQRMRCWLLLMLLAGLRCAEVAALRPGDLVLDPAPLLRLRETKGGNEQTVPAHPIIVQELALLPMRSGAWWSVKPNHVSAEVARFLRSVGIEGTAHQLRHSAATMWYRASGNDLLTTQRLLRHANVSSTMIYADVEPQRPAEVVAAMRLPA